ncbi:MAG: CPBP family intramembrane metalloprotease [Lachnospiraceae bacterium]|nr:CPBP family intramembrane metalloprotease [Lachnospiraceae bacterium]
MPRNIFKKIGWFFVSILPAFLSLALQFGAAFLIMFVITLMAFSGYYGAGLSQDEIMQVVQTVYSENMIWVVAGYQLIGIVIFGLWYYLVWGRKKRAQNVEKPGAKGIFAIILLGILLQAFISGALGILDTAFPSLMKNYKEIMEAAGLVEMNAIAILATGIMAPVGEELLCRGIMFRLAGKVSDKFWVANCIQALAFGIIHANLVQGTYAFFLGLILGYIYGKYRNIWLCMLLHASVNLSANFIEYLWEALPEQNGMLFVGLICAGCLAFIVLIYLLLGKIKPLEEAGETIGGIEEMRQ